MMNHIDLLFCCIDDFCKIFCQYEENHLISNGCARNRQPRMSLSERLTIAILYHSSEYKNFKYFYKSFILTRPDLFPNPLSYNRFVELMPRLTTPLAMVIHLLKGEETGTYFIDATKLQICHNKRTSSNKVFKGMAVMGKSSYGWFMGFKLHIIINNIGEIMAVKITRGNVDDRVPVEELTADLTGKIFADKGYIDKKLWLRLWKKSLHLIHGIRKNMINYLMPLEDKVNLRKRSLVETVFGIMKNVFNLEHTRHRSPANFLVNTMSCIVAYMFKYPKNNNIEDKFLIPN